MTDREMALKLGNYIIKLQREISALQGVFTEYRIDTPQGRREIPWRSQAEKIAQEEGPMQVAAAQQYSLLQAIGHETDGSVLIRALHREFLEEV